MGRELNPEPGSIGLTEEDIVHIPGLVSQWVRLEDGSRAHYVSSGETGPAVILLHGGLPGSSGTAGWRFMAPFLGAHGFRVYCPDRPGFGLADTRPEHWPTRGWQSQVEFVRMFADALGIDKFHISGNSMGCMTSSYFVVHHPERILSFALIAGGIGDQNDKPRIAPKDGKFTPNPDFVNTPFTGTEESMRDLMAGIIYEAKAIWPELITMRTKAALRQADSLKAWQDSNVALANDPNYLQWLSTKDRINKVSMPGIYLHGLQDVFSVVENGFNQEDALPNVQFFYPDQCGHQGQTDQPDLFNQVFLEFFRDGKVSRKTADAAGVSKRRPELPNLVEQAAGVTA
jgi:2-hydroxy-6-oxonona-2,4-dienedioate hydrolase